MTNEGMPEVNIPEKREIVRLPDGRVVERTTMQTGTVKDQLVFPGDYPDAVRVEA